MSLGTLVRLGMEAYKAYKSTKSDGDAEAGGKEQSISSPKKKKKTEDKAKTQMQSGIKAAGSALVPDQSGFFRVGGPGTY